MSKNIVNLLCKLDNFSLSGDYSFTKSIKNGFIYSFILESPFLILDKQSYSERDLNQFKNVCSITKSLNKNLNKIRNLYEVIYSEFNLDKYNVYIPFQEHNPYLTKMQSFKDFKNNFNRSIGINKDLYFSLTFKKTFIFNDLVNSIIPMPIVSFRYKDKIIFEITLDIEKQVFYLINKDYQVNSLSELYKSYNEISVDEILYNLLCFMLKTKNIESNFTINSKLDFNTYKSFLNLLIY